MTKHSDIKLRAPSTVMRLDRMGSFHQSRLSFMRHLLRTLKQEKWHFARSEWQIDHLATGVAVYTATGAHETYSLIAFSHEIPDHMRSDRVIATEWDATFCLYDGIPSQEDLQRLECNVPKQEDGRVSSSELIVSRANRSGRLWQYVIDCLARGEQPDRKNILEVGYLMRTTAVYGSGKLGSLDRIYLLDRPLARLPFALEMLSVYLIRWFVLDLIEHIAACKGGDRSCRLAPDIRRLIGIGNSTGLGMTPFLMNHPALLHHWISARETALLRVRQIVQAGAQEIEIFSEFVHRASLNATQWHSSHPLQIQKITSLKQDMTKLSRHIQQLDLQENYSWNKLVIWSENALSLEGQEQLVSLLLEPYGKLVDHLSEAMHVNENNYFIIDADKTTADLQQQLDKNYKWIWDFDFSKKESQARFWYISEEKLEPRLGERYTEPGAELEQPFCIARDAQIMYKKLASLGGAPISLGVFLRGNPDMRYLVRRVLQAELTPYSEIHDNLVDAEIIPIDMLRCKLSFFGVTHFDPRSDRWLRVCMYQHAPFPTELATASDDCWCYPKA